MRDGAVDVSWPGAREVLPTVRDGQAPVAVDPEPIEEVQRRAQHHELVACCRLALVALEPRSGVSTLWVQSVRSRLRAVLAQEPLE